MADYRVQLRHADRRYRRLKWWEDVPAERVGENLAQTIFLVRKNAATRGCTVLRIRDKSADLDVYGPFD